MCMTISCGYLLSYYHYDIIHYMIFVTRVIVLDSHVIVFFVVCSVYGFLFCFLLLLSSAGTWWATDSLAYVY